MQKLIIDNNYEDWLLDLKNRIKTSQIKAAVSVNSELINLYRYIGKQIVEMQFTGKYGDGIIKKLAFDLKREFPVISGFSYSNLKNCKQFYNFWQNFEISQQAVGFFERKDINLIISQIPWGHNILIIQKIKNHEEALFYVQETITNNWSRAILQIQIESKLYLRQGKAINNFLLTMPKPQSDLASQILKDPYNFNFLTLDKKVQELELENQLINNITYFLLELGKGFAYMGRQFVLKVSSKEYRLDLLFYHVKLKCYIVIELKTNDFEPEYIGKLNFYLSAIDTLLKDKNDAPTIGILLCKNKDNIIVEFALKDVNKPIGVSEFTFNELPVEIQRELPSVEELENELIRI